MCHRSYSFTWNRGGKPAGSNPAPAGLYTFDVEVEANPYDRDAVRSQALSVDLVLGGLYYDDKGTEDESDDEEFLVVEYVLKSDRNASSGEIWLYDPDLNRIGRWDIYGLTALQKKEFIGLCYSSKIITLTDIETIRLKR